MLKRIVAGVEWIGGQGTRAVAVVLFLGLALPPLSSLMRPVLPLAVFFMLVLAFVRVDGTAVTMRIRRPTMVILATIWLMIAIPLIVALMVGVFGTGLHPDLAAALIVMAASAPIMSAPAFTYLLGLDGTLSVAIMVACMTLTPVTAPLLVEILAGDRMVLSGMELATRLAALLAGSLAVALVFRRWIGTERIAARARLVDGLNILMLLIFAIALMDGVVATAIADPWLAIGIILLAFAANLLLMVLSGIAFAGVGLETALTIGIAGANRNMGMMAAAMAGAAPEMAWLYFALGQFPIFLMPQIIKPPIEALLTRVRPQTAAPRSD